MWLEIARADALTASQAFRPHRVMCRQRQGHGKPEWYRGAWPLGYGLGKLMLAAQGAGGVAQRMEHISVVFRCISTILLIQVSWLASRNALVKLPGALRSLPGALHSLPGMICRRMCGRYFNNIVQPSAVSMSSPKVPLEVVDYPAVTPRRRA